MANFTSTIEYKFKVTNNLDKADAQQKKFNFYLGLPYSKRKYRYMQVVNFIIKDGTHLFTVILGHSESSVAAMSEDILRNDRSAFKPAVTKVMRITYASVNVGQVAFLCNASNKETFEGADWTGISGEYTKVKSFRTNGNDEVIGLIFDAADRNVVSARKNDGTNVVAKPEAPADEVKVPQPEKPVIDIDTANLWKAHQKLIGDYGTLRMAKEELEQKAKGLTEINEGFKKDLDKRDADISALVNQLEEKERFIKTLIEGRDSLKKELAGRDANIELLSKENADFRIRLKGTESKPDETQKAFKDKFIDKIVDGFRAKLEELPDDELLMKGSIVHYDIWY